MPDEPPQSGAVDWRPADFLGQCDFQDIVEGCDAVIHLAAELSDMSKMERVNGHATRSLVQAAEKSGVRLFIYTSSTCVYGMPRQRLITEETSTISTERGRHADFSAADYLVEYGRTKLLGERAITDSIKNVKYVIFRPSNIADDSAILAPLQWNARTRMWRGSRCTHQIYFSDAVSAISFMLEKRLYGSGNEPQVSIYNLSNDDEASNRYIDLFQEAAQRNGRLGFAPLAPIPGWLDWQKDRIKFRRPSVGYPPGMVRYLPTKLLSDGFVHPLGIKAARARALASLGNRA